MDEKIFYVSLVRGLVGYYVKFIATSEDVVRKHVYEYFGRMWCSVYSELPKKAYDLRIINEDRPIRLGNEWKWE